MGGRLTHGKSQETAQLRQGGCQPFLSASAGTLLDFETKYLSDYKHYEILRAHHALCPSIKRLGFPCYADLIMLIYAAASRDSSRTDPSRNQNAAHFPDTASFNPSIFDPSLRSRWIFADTRHIPFDSLEKLLRYLEVRHAIVGRHSKLDFAVRSYPVSSASFVYTYPVFLFPTLPEAERTRYPVIYSVRQ
jgi:hypothetical protein